MTPIPPLCGDYIPPFAFYLGLFLAFLLGAVVAFLFDDRRPWWN